MAPALCFCFQLAIGRIRGAEAIPQPSAVLTDLLKLCCQVFRALAPASQLLARLGELGHLKVVQACQICQLRVLKAHRFQALAEVLASVHGLPLRCGALLELHVQCLR